MSRNHLQHFFRAYPDATNMAATYHRNAPDGPVDIYFTQYTSASGDPYTAALYLSLLYFKKFRTMPPLVMINYATKLDYVLMKLTVELHKPSSGSPKVDAYNTYKLDPTDWKASDLDPFSSQLKGYEGGWFKLESGPMFVDNYDVPRQIDLTRVGLDPEYNSVPRLYLAVAQYLATNRRFCKNLPQGKAVGTLLVAQNGEILAWGVNTNQDQEGYRHAEVNMFLSFWTRTKQPVPNNSLIITTLQCCQQCCAMIDLACANSTGVEEWYGMADLGSFGNATPKDVKLYAIGGDTKSKTKPLHLLDKSKKPIKGTDLGDTMATSKTGAAATWVGKGGPKGGAQYAQMAGVQLSQKLEKYHQVGVTTKNPESRVPEIIHRIIEPFLSYVGVSWTDLRALL